MTNKAIFATTKDPDIYYVSRVRVSDPILYLETNGNKYVYVSINELDIFKQVYTGSDMQPMLLYSYLDSVGEVSNGIKPEYKAVATIFGQHNLLDQVVQVPASFPLALADYLREEGFVIESTDNLFPERVIKTENEVVIIEDTIKRICEVFGIVENILRDSQIKNEQLILSGQVVTSEYLKTQIELLLLQRGLECAEGMIVSSGKHTAIPHHEGAGPIQANTPIIIDLYPQDKKSGYFGDMTRTYVKGSPSSYFKEMYTTVLAAQDTAFKLIRPGSSVKEIYKSVSKVFLDAGFDVGEKGFVHGVGHGIGIEIHEAPYLGKYANGQLEVGNVVTVEPGLYYKEHGGVRIEDVVAVTESGYRNLTNYSRELKVFT